VDRRTIHPEFGVEDANANCPKIFKNCYSEFTKTRHFERKINFFSAEGAA